MKKIRFDLNNMFSCNIGAKHGVDTKRLEAVAPAAERAFDHIAAVSRTAGSRIPLALEWMCLPYQPKETVRAVQKLGNEIASGYENVLFLGIGGSYLGLKAAQDALKAPYYNEFAALRNGRPRVYFDGNNLDPETLSALLGNLDPKKTFAVVISKSGETTETKAAFAVVERWLRRGAGKRYGRQIAAITDKRSGSLRKKVDAEQKKDPKSFRSLPLLAGVGGRFSEFNMGLLHLAIIGVDVSEVLAGAAAMAKRCTTRSLEKNPALLYAALHHLLYKEKGKPIAITMPFSEMLRSTADWYAQLLGESLGKKYARKIVRTDGAERWIQDTKRVVNVGRTPVPCRGTNDLHSIQQNNIEGENDKTVTFIRVERFRNDITLPPTGDFLGGKNYARLLAVAQEATEWALVQESRPNCTIIMPELTPYHWGGLLFFFEMAIAYEGELLKINAFDQPGVEGYKNYMYYKLKKPGLSKDVAENIRRHPLVKMGQYII